jgi:hypothetical protein
MVYQDYEVVSGMNDNEKSSVRFRNMSLKHDGVEKIIRAASDTGESPSSILTPADQSKRTIAWIIQR